MVKPTKSLRPVLITIAVTVLVIVLLNVTRPDKGAGLRDPAVTQVQLVTVSRIDLAPVERLAGRLQPMRRAMIKFEVPGQVSKRLVEPGQYVITGTLLLQLDDGDYREAADDAHARLQQEKAAIIRDQRLLELAMKNRKLQQLEVARLKKLTAGTLVSRSRLDAAQQRLLQLQQEEARLAYSVRTAKARLALKQVALSKAVRNLQRSRLRAPFEGFVNRVEYQKGDAVSVNSLAVEMVDLRYLELYLEVRREVVEALKIDQPVAIETASGKVNGRIVAVQLDPDSNTFTHAVRIRLPIGKGTPGALAHASLPLSALKQVMVVPAAAVVQEDGVAWAMRFDNGKLQRRVLKLGPRVGDKQVVISGLGPGDKVVAQDVASLTDGQKAAASGN